MMGQIKITKKKLANSKSFFILFLTGLIVCFISLAILSCGSTPKKSVKQPTPQPKLEAITPKQIIIKEPDPPELELARDANQNAADALQKAEQAQQTKGNILQSPAEIEALILKARSKSELAEEDARMAVDKAREALRVSGEAERLIRQELRSSHQTQQSAEHVRQKVLQAQKTSNLARQSMEKAERSMKEAEQAVKEAKKSADYAKKSVSTAEYAVQAQASLGSAQKARVLAEKASELIGQTEPKSLDAQDLVQESRRLADKAERLASMDKQSNEDLQRIVGKSWQLIAPAEEATRRVREKVDQTEYLTDRSGKAVNQVSEKLERLIVPDLVGKSLRDAKEMLKNRVLGSTVVYRRKSVGDKVLEQDPEPGGKKRILTPVELIVSKQVMTDYPKESKVPEVKACSLRKAIRLLEDQSLSWNVVRISDRPIKNPPTVLNQKPGSGSMRKIKNPVELVITSSREFPEQKKTKVPSVKGMSLVDAKEKLWKKKGWAGN